MKRIEKLKNRINQITNREAIFIFLFTTIIIEFIVDSIWLDIIVLVLASCWWFLFCFNKKFNIWQDKKFKLKFWCEC